MTPTNDNGVHFQRLDPNRIDVVLGSARSRVIDRPRRDGRGGLWALLLIAAGAAYWGLSGREDGQPPVPAPPVAEANEPQPVTLVQAAVASQVVNQVVIINAPTKAARPQAQAQPETLPTVNTPQGMVSAQYLAHFKAGNGRTNVAPPRSVQVVTVTIREWDGPNRYAAKWRVEDNVIDQGSVCFNFPGDSIEHRECRRAAQQYFRTQCKDWTRRAEKAHDKGTREARGQACEVAQVFVP